MAKGIDGAVKEGAYPVLETLTLEQQVVIQKLLRSVFGPSISTESGDWQIDEAKVSLTDRSIKISNLICEQSGQPQGGRGRSLVEMAVGNDLRPTYNSFKLSLKIGLPHLGGMSKGDLEILFGADLAETLFFAVVAEGDFDKDVEEEVAMAKGQIGRELDKALGK